MPLINAALCSSNLITATTGLKNNRRREKPCKKHFMCLAVQFLT